MTTATALVFWLHRWQDFIRSAVGAPWVDHPTERTKRGPRRVMYARMSGYADVVGDTYRLDVFKRVMTLLGACRLSAMDLEILAGLDPTDGATYTVLAEAADEAQASAGAFWRAERGTWCHAVLECVDLAEPITEQLYEEGERWGFDSVAVDDLAEQWAAFLVRSAVRVLAVEARVVNDTFSCAGTLDRFVEMARPMRFANGTIVEPGSKIVDLKTSQLRLAAGEPAFWGHYTAQIYLYATAVPYLIDVDERGRRRERRAVWPWGQPSTTQGLIAHINLEGPRPAFSWWLADLEAGRELTLLAWGTRQFERRRGLFAAGRD